MAKVTVSGAILHTDGSVHGRKLRMRAWLACAATWPSGTRSATHSATHHGAHTDTYIDAHHATAHHIAGAIATHTAHI